MLTRRRRSSKSGPSAAVAMSSAAPRTPRIVRRTRGSASLAASMASESAEGRAIGSEGTTEDARVAARRLDGGRVGGDLDQAVIKESYEDVSEPAGLTSVLA